LAVASMMRVLERAPFPDHRFLGRLATGLIHGPLTARKMQGSSRNRPLFCEIRLESNCKFSGLRDELPSDHAGN
jgi:hypothetical protein